MSWKISPFPGCRCVVVATDSLYVISAKINQKNHFPRFLLFLCVFLAPLQCATSRKGVALRWFDTAGRPAYVPWFGGQHLHSPRGGGSFSPFSTGSTLIRRWRNVAPTVSLHCFLFPMHWNGSFLCCVSPMSTTVPKILYVQTGSLTEPFRFSDFPSPPCHFFAPFHCVSLRCVAQPQHLLLCFPQPHYHLLFLPLFHRLSAHFALQLPFFRFPSASFPSISPFCLRIVKRNGIVFLQPNKHPLLLFPCFPSFLKCSCFNVYWPVVEQLAISSISCNSLWKTVFCDMWEMSQWNITVDPPNCSPKMFSIST